MDLNEKCPDLNIRLFFGTIYVFVASISTSKGRSDENWTDDGV